MNDIEKNHLDEEVRRTLDLLEAHPRREASPWFAGRVLAQLRRPATPRGVAGWQWAAAGLLLLLNTYAFLDQSGAVPTSSTGQEQPLTDLYDPGEEPDALFYFASPNDLYDEFSPTE